MSDCGTNSCLCHASTAVSQSMDEMDFEKGLWGAASDGNLARIRDLINKGKNPNDPDSYGYTALHYAARGGRVEVVRELLSRGACPRAQTRGGATPGHRAAYAGHEAVLWSLLVDGAESLVDSDGDTVVHKAVKGGHHSLALEIIARFPGLATVRNNRQQLYDLREAAD
ncbi:ankyrin repeat domain-containing protein 39 [Galendromus occidentalis]|uniref:Ankyrin repeat domain-containing protein 39 n=1 Tax=Galendromus occidentalis TaxID=34638 RepID=A0AAJ6QX33_9ACAR|nr:ankyrin repeat domain-containing protein 39 [Galendromus occidentalis]